MSRDQAPRTLTLGQLIESLSEYPADAQIRIAHQPSWPFEYGLGGVVSDLEIAASRGQEVRRVEVVWLVEGILIGHFSEEAWRVASKKMRR